MFVHIVPGDPWALKPNQYAFDAHHDKFETHVQELRPSPAVPFIHGFTMPTKEKDAETHACFKQVLLRPHRCDGPEHCLGCGAAAGFCDARTVRRQRRDEHGIPEEDAFCRPRFRVERVYSFLPPWRTFQAKQLALAEAADVKIRASRKYPVLPDVTLLRSWWMPGAVQGGVVHDKLVPILQLALPIEQVWYVLRFAGHIRDEEGCVIGIAGNIDELRAVRELTGLGQELCFTSPGVHDEQLTPAELFAWRRVECDAQLDKMAVARGRPRPGVAHPEAEADDPDGVHGGERPDDAEFDGEDALPGGDGDASDVDECRGQVDPEIKYAARHPVTDDQVFDVVHRYEEANKQRRNARSMKRELLDKFMKRHERTYQDVRRCFEVAPICPGDPPRADAAKHRADAYKQQEAIQEARAKEASATIQGQPGAAIQLCREAAALAQVRPLAANELPCSPIEMAAELISQSGVWRSKEQYLAVLFVLQPLQQLWERALREGTMDEFQQPGGIVRLSRDMPVRSVFLHGPGGSGKTHCMTEVVIKVVRHFVGARGAKAIAAHNSAARLLKGKTMHAAGKMTRGQSMKAAELKPKSHARKALEAEWLDPLLLLADELGLAAPPLLAGISRRAFHGRARPLRLDPADAMEHPFGDVLLQALMADFMQLNPVLSHTLLETFCTSRVPGVPHKTEDEDRDGYRVFRNCCKNVIIFTGTYRFLDEDLPALLNIMCTPGGRAVPDELKAKISARIEAGPEDPRYSADYIVEGRPGFFVFGAHAAIQWEQVARMMNLRVPQMARRCCGPVALRNQADGTPDAQATLQTRPQGQLVYYFQRVDRFKHPQTIEQHMHTLRFVNLSKCAGLHGMLGLFVGMRVRLTKKQLGPELVQEATGEVVDLAFHPDERFGDPASSNIRPADAHECWERGWVKCDYLPLHVEVRWDDCAEDYTGLGKPGVWHLKPKQDVWKMPIDTVAIIDHPRAPGPKVVKLSSRKQATIEVTSSQEPLTHEDDMTFQNVQGKTIRGPEKQPKGFVVDMYKPQNMGPEEYFQHIYMVMGRARKLEWLLLRNFPSTPDGELDWTVFEKGLPAYLCEFMEALEGRARATWPRLLQCQRALGLPAWEDLKPCLPDPDHEERFLYVPEDWGFQRRGCSVPGAVPLQSQGSQNPPRPPPPPHAPRKRRRRSNTTSVAPIVEQTTAPAPPVSAEPPRTECKQTGW